MESIGVTPPYASKSETGIFLLWDSQTHLVKAITEKSSFPQQLVPYPDRNWPDQLDANVCHTILYALQADKPSSMLVSVYGVNWRINVTPTESSHYLLFVELATDHSFHQGLNIFELRKAIIGYEGLERNLKLLEMVSYLTHCERLILWQVNQQQLRPVFVSSGEKIPPQTADRRFIKAIFSRKQLSFSDLYHQPLLVGQTYYHESPILARLDTAIMVENQLFGLLSLEFRQIQDQFAPELFLLADTAATLLMTDSLPEAEIQLALPLDE